MADEKNDLIGKLRSAGISRAAINAAWPSWWNEEAANSPSGRAELRFALARRLGLEARPLLGERVEFTWNDEARFKHLSTQGQAERSVLTSYGIAIGRLLLRASSGQQGFAADALTLRAAILTAHNFVDLQSLLATCWAIGVPVIHLRVFPLEAKAMHAMVVTIDGRFAILLGRDAAYPAPIAFTLAHELGHILLGHLDGTSALVDLEDPATAEDGDGQEQEADAFALTLLTGSADPDIQTNIDSFNAAGLAKAVLAAAPEHRVEPGTLALCLAYRRNAWPVANAALRQIYTESKPVWREINGIADHQINWENLNDESTHYLRNVIAGE
ncbi:ImmA/IrrE family metallo-endopeptidase [Phenylobacterium sp.]|uniref:ImmA/IrrE family metallo-endopeptidase n=1 Tax=Phenylobacterium sp. TaxID=1871053 RepID=UPI0027371B99|nr:ImmA/IrrE family metallo-endopeptidase [Phenylobacterium sp.]MDP3634927.1 ImmA/IrrE family metallo-endopeptidase [Phenylobacterium sp.]